MEPSRKAWVDANRERVNAKNRQWRAAHAKQVNAARNKRRKENPDRVYAIHKAWHRAHPHKQRQYVLKTLFGITTDDYSAMLSSQGGVCAICRREERTVFRGRVTPLSVDHDHNTGAIRGLLCRTCNSMIGFCGEDVNILMSAHDYLIRYNSQDQ